MDARLDAIASTGLRKRIVRGRDLGEVVDRDVIRE
jgi:hypothetical protein